MTNPKVVQISVDQHHPITTQSLSQFPFVGRTSNFTGSYFE